jgi:hypothetical protein
MSLPARKMGPAPNHPSASNRWIFCIGLNRKWPPAIASLPVTKPDLSAIYLWHTDSPPLGYKLAADYCQHYDPRYGNGLSGPSRIKILEIVRFMFTIEALEEGPE